MPILLFLTIHFAVLGTSCGQGLISRPRLAKRFITVTAGLWTRSILLAKSPSGTPQLIRTNPALAQTILKAAEQAMTPGMTKLVWDGLSSMAAKGDSTKVKGTNLADPTGLRYNYPTITSGGVSDIPQSGATTKIPTTATIHECANDLTYTVGANNQPVAGIAGYPGPTQWTDQLIKTANGWQVERFGYPTKATSC